MNEFVKESIRRVTILREEIQHIVNMHKQHDVQLSEQWISVIATKNLYISKIEDALVNTKSVE
jgi:hypothetical protein